MEIQQIKSLPRELRDDQFLLFLESRSEHPHVPAQVSHETHKMQSLARRQEFAQSRSQIFKMASELFGHPEGHFHVDKKENGKPFLRDLEELDLNISHATEFVASSLCRQGETGFDIETIARFSGEIGRKEERWLHKDEIESLKSFKARELQVELCRLWTKKEAYAKGKELGVAIGFRELNVFSSELPFSSFQIGGSIVSISAPESITTVLIYSELKVSESV